MIRYREGYKYQLAEDYSVLTPIYPDNTIEHEFFTLTTDGLLLIRRGYAWDGASGPTFDTKSSMRPSLVHDCFCQMMRDRTLDFATWQKRVNKLFYEMCIEDGMWRWRAALWYAAVEFADAGNPNQGPDDKVLEAP
jgi:hypothetical protein